MHLRVQPYLSTNPKMMCVARVAFASVACGVCVVRLSNITGFICEFTVAAGLQLKLWKEFVSTFGADTKTPVLFPTRFDRRNVVYDHMT